MISLKVVEEIWIDYAAQEDAGVYNVIKNSWDEFAGWHYELVKSFTSADEAREFIRNNPRK